MVIEVCFLLSVALNPCENCFQVSPLRCGACGMPIARFNLVNDVNSVDVVTTVFARLIAHPLSLLTRSGVTAGVPQEEARGRRRRQPRLRPHRGHLVFGGHPDPACLSLHPGLPPSPAVPSADAAPCLPTQLLLLLLRLLLGTRPTGRRGQPTRAPGGSAAQAAGRQRPVVRSKF